MDRPHLRSQSILDFIKWHEDKALLLSPKFQRRRVWPPKAKSYLIDTILRELPIPKIYMRQQLDLPSKRIQHEVVDGQQRIAATLEFYAGKLKLSKIHPEYPGSTFEDLPDEAKAAFLKYEFSVDLLIGATDADVLDIFARINSYSVPLNAQEKRNAAFFGAFKQCVYSLSREHLEFWKKHGILSDQVIARMREAELTSEIVVGMIDGLQDKKKSLDKFYRSLDESFPQASAVTAHFRATIDLIEDLLGDLLADTNFKRPPLFYSLFLAFYNLKFGDEILLGKKVFTKANREGIRARIVELSDAIELEPPPQKFGKFVTASQRQTDNLNPRKIRHQAIIAALKG